MAFSTIDKSSSFINPKIYDGNSSTNAITGVGFQPDVVWMKQRNGVVNHYLYDAVRGDTNRLQPNMTTVADTTDSTWFNSFDSDGFTIGSEDNINDTGDTYVSWNWKMGTTTGIAGSPSITPASYSFNATAGQSIIKYVGNGVSGATIPHGLSTAPKMVIIKNLDSVEGWVVGNESVGWTKRMKLNTTDAAVTSSAYFNDTSPSTTLVTIGNDGGVNTDTDNYIAYCFSEVAGYSKFGSYTGNGNADGAFVYTGFKPSFLMIKKTNGTSQWPMTDSARSPSNEAHQTLYANVSNAEVGMAKDLLSNGFKCKTSDGDINGNGDSYIYMAFGQPIISNSGVCATAR